ncbi:MAG: hypothetical protein U0163_20680 [Gemmatimonadaceae bacterium]
MSMALDGSQHHRFDITTDVSDLGELRGLDLDERCARQLRQSTGDLRFDTVGPIRMMLFGEISSRMRQGAPTAPPVAQGNRDGLGLLAPTMTDPAPRRSASGVEIGESCQGLFSAW